MIRVAIVASACVLLASCGSDLNERYADDPAATKAAEDQYSVCLTESATRLDDGRSEAAAVGNTVARACYAKFLQIQVADGDEAREEFERTHSAPTWVIMYQQDQAEQTRRATQAVLVHRQKIEERAEEGTSSAGEATNATAPPN